MIMGKVARDETMQGILTEIRGIHAIMDAQAREESVTSWASYKRFVDYGVAPEEFPVASTLVDSWELDSEHSYTAPWDVVHYDRGGNAYLKQHYAIPKEIQFDAPEALYYAPAGGLAAGQYYIDIGMNYGTGWGAGDHINFTTEGMNEGDQLVLATRTSSDTNPTNGIAWTVYAAGSTEPKETGVTANSDEGTLIGSTNTESVSKTNGQVNAPQRVVYGYNRWSQSGIRQYLNSAAGAGNWWSKQNGWDRPPTQLATVRGWLAGCSEEFLSILKPVAVTTALNTVEGFTETTEVTYDRIFLPSLQEMYIVPQLSGAEGEDWDYYKELASSLGLAGRFETGSSHVYPELKHYKVDATTSAVGVWLRSAGRGYAYNPWSVNSSGIVGNYYAYHAFRGCPACKIEKSI